MLVRLVNKQSVRLGERLAEALQPGCDLHRRQRRVIALPLEKPGHGLDGQAVPGPPNPQMRPVATGVITESERQARRARGRTGVVPRSARRTRASASCNAQA